MSADLGRDGEVRPAVGRVEPGPLRSRRAEPVRGPVALPRDGDAAAVAAGVDSAGAEPHRVLAALERDVLDLRQAELLALVDVHRAGQRHREQRRRPRAARAALEVGRGARAAWTRMRTTYRPGRSASRAASRRGWRAPRSSVRRPERARPARCRSTRAAAPGSHGQERKSKLKAVCSSSGRRYRASRSGSGSQISPTRTRGSS